ncbi:MAG TPA: ABC transporter ATP-binding protein [Anaerolineaceae bacterium]|jgi:putative ABC transport system ATP-binding protein|nr:ABC transporter ATP-binding protein [Anaerolineaceae bacterium]
MKGIIRNFSINDPQTPLIQVSRLTKTYHDGAVPLDALHEIDLTVSPGEYIGVIGKSGAGKTTLINMLSGVDQISSGNVMVNGTMVQTLKEDQLALWRGLNVGVIYQSFNLLPMLNLRDNITLAMDFCGRYRRGKSEQKALDLLESVELKEHAYKPPAFISGGQKQRVAIARALANDPPLILADEPTGRLDSATSETIFQIFETLIRQGKTILMVSHDRALSRRVDRVIELADGQIVSDSGGRHDH